MIGTVDVVVVISGIEEHSNYPETGSVQYAGTKVFRFEFETEQDALMFLDTSDEPHGLVNEEQLKAGPA
jgi:hypothetical protein